LAQGRVWTGAQARERGLVDRTGSLADALAAARTRARLADDAPVRYLEPDAGRLARVLEYFGGAAVQALGPWVAGVWAPPGLPAGVTQDLRRDLGWIAEVADRRKPFAAVVHCLCEAVQ
jgi:protease IV